MLRDSVVRLNKFVDRFMWLAVPLGVIVGISLGERISSYSYLGQYLFMLLTLTEALRLEAREFFTVIKHPMAIFVYLVVGKLIIPPLCTLLIRLVMKGNTDAVTGYVLVMTGPVAVASLIWTSIFGGNGSLTLAILMIDTLLTPLYMPFATKLLLGKSVVFEMKSMIYSLLKMVILPMVLGIGANELSKNKIKTNYSVYLKPIGKSALLGAAVFNCSKLSKEVATLRPEDWILILSSFIVLGCSFLLGKGASVLTKTDDKNTVALTVCSGLKNNTASLIIANSFFSTGAALSCVVHILLQQTFCALIGKFLFRHRSIQSPRPSPMPYSSKTVS